MSALAQATTSPQRFVLTTHINPDGDGLGAEVALAAALRQLGKSVAVLNDAATPEEYRFLDPDGVLQRYSTRQHAPIIRDAEMVMLLDAGSPDRTDRLSDELTRFRGTTAVIDHHVGVIWGDRRLVDPTACLATTLVLALLKRLDATFTPEMGLCPLHRRTGRHDELPERQHHFRMPSSRRRVR